MREIGNHSIAIDPLSSFIPAFDEYQKLPHLRHGSLESALAFALAIGDSF
jgi:hypothetical protein